MKSLLLILALMIGSFSYSQTTSNVFTEEWYESIDEPINFITYKNRCSVTIQFRVYRGFEENYSVTLVNSKGIKVWEGKLKKVDEIDISNIYEGVYILTVTDSGGNSMSKEVVIG
jgi:uncharacterized protein YpmB